MRRSLRSDWQAHYESRLCSAEDAAAQVNSGDRIGIPAGHGSPGILAALATRAGSLENVEVRGLAVPAARRRLA